MANTPIQGGKYDDAIIWEEDNKFSRDDVTVASGSNMVMLEVAGKLTSGGAYVPLDPAASTGAEDASGIIGIDTDASSAAKASWAVVRDAIVVADNLVWPTGITAGEKTTALAELKALGIVEREVA